jgi:ADP-ribose pyrophosphatase
MSDQNWHSLGTRELLRMGTRLRVFAEHVRLPDGREITDYLQYRGQPFVQIVAITEEGRFLLERQYKHGARRVIVTLPAGHVESGEEPLAAAQRELLEETGHVSDDWKFLALGVMHANAGGSTGHTFLARNCRKIREPASGDLEEMVIESQCLAELLQTLAKGDVPLMSDGAALLSAFLTLGLVALG